jgi:GNAT superfamily N-acetyltransferase
MTVSVRLEPMTAERFTTYRADAVVYYGRHIFESGAMPEQEAMEKGEADFARLLPDGLESEGHLFLTAYDGDEEVGMVWLHLEEKSDGVHAFGYDFSVREDLRRSGYGRAIMVAAEQECRDRGVVAVGLSVFGFNLGAQALYQQMGFEVTAVQMRKRLEPATPS